MGAPRSASQVDRLTQRRPQGQIKILSEGKLALSLACSISPNQELETAYGRMEMFISFYKGEIERD